MVFPVGKHILNQKIAFELYRSLTRYDYLITNLFSFHWKHGPRQKLSPLPVWNFVNLVGNIPAVKYCRQQGNLSILRQFQRNENGHPFHTKSQRLSIKFKSSPSSLSDLCLECGFHACNSFVCDGPCCLIYGAP
jgi:hypothetical protein